MRFLHLTNHRYASAPALKQDPAPAHYESDVN